MTIFVYAHREQGTLNVAYKSKPNCADLLEEHHAPKMACDCLRSVVAGIV